LDALGWLGMRKKRDSGLGIREQGLGVRRCEDKRGGRSGNAAGAVVVYGYGEEEDCEDVRHCCEGG
jgi:hypothetical protein